MSRENLDQFSDAYAKTFNFEFDNNIILNWYPKRILEMCSQKGSLLELGLGHGYTTNIFSGHFSSHLVIDGSSQVIKQFYKHYPNSKVDVVEQYFEGFETDKKFDVIVMGFILEHVDDPVLILKKFKSFLAPGGCCFIAVPNAESLHRRFGHEAGLLNNVGDLGAGDLELGHQRYYSVTSLTQDLTCSGYKIIKREGLFLKPFTTSQLQGMKLSDNVIQAMCVVGRDYPELSCALLFEAG